MSLPYKCEDCGRSSAHPGYCVRCLLQHSAVSQTVSYGLSDAPGARREGLLTPFQAEYLEALQRLRDANHDLRVQLEGWCAGCLRKLGAKAWEPGTKTAPDLAYRSADGKVRCEDCYMAHISHGTATLRVEVEA